uniref:Regulatory protein zeste n=1 Tax=Culicoides sonorensis TaxID=179676 RepID=A0A336MTM0_CULSO
MTENSKKGIELTNSQGDLIIVGPVKKENAKYLRKTSEAQKLLLIEYFETHEGAIEIVSSNNTDGDIKRQIWAEVAQIVNQVEGGVEKTELKWSKTWADMKLYTKNRARAAKQGHAVSTARRPNDMDRRILKVCGNDDLLRDWENAVNESPEDLKQEYTYHKIRLADTDQEIVVADGTDYEFIEEEELTENLQENSQDNSRVIARYYEGHPTRLYEFSDENTLQEVKMERQQSNKRKRVKHEPEEHEVIEMHEMSEQEDSSEVKRMKEDIESEEQPQNQEEPETRRTRRSSRRQ